MTATNDNFEDTPTYRAPYLVLIISRLLDLVLVPKKPAKVLKVFQSFSSKKQNFQNSLLLYDRTLVPTFSNFLVNRWSSASFSKSAIGSAPGERTNMSGEFGVPSLKQVARSNAGGSINRCPRWWVTKSCARVSINF